MGLITLGKNYLYWTFSVVIAGHLVHTKNKIWRTFWSILLIATIVAFFLHSASTLIEYLSYEKTTVIRLYSASSAPFPAVTICNLNPFKNSAIDQSQTLSNLISAYKYTLEKKKATSSSEVHARKKRAPTPSACDKTVKSKEKAPSLGKKQNYIISGFYCDTVYNLTFELCGNPDLTITLTNITDVQLNDYEKDIDTAIYLCFHDSFCENFCNTWDSGLDALTNLTECDSKKFKNPPGTNEFNYMALIAESYSSYCNLSDKGCELGLYKKISTEYPGNYWYKDCYYGRPYGNDANLLTITMNGCDSGTSYQLETYLLSNCTGQVENISDLFSIVLDETDCGTTCDESCPFTGTDYCFYNQKKLCNFYKMCTTTGVTTTSQSTTRLTPMTTSEQSTTAPISSTLTSEQSSVESTTTSEIINTLGSKHTITATTDITTTSAALNPTINGLTTTNGVEMTASSTIDFSEIPTIFSTTSIDNAESTTVELSTINPNFLTKSTTLKDEAETIEQDPSSSSTTTSYSTTVFPEATITSSTNSESTKTNLPSTDSSSSVTTAQSNSKTSTLLPSTTSTSTTKINMPLTTKSSSILSSLSTTASKKPATLTTEKSGTSKNSNVPVTSTTEKSGTSQNSDSDVPTSKSSTTSSSQIITTKSSTQLSPSKTSSSFTSSTKQIPSTSNYTTSSTLSTSSLKMTSPLNSHTISSEITKTTSITTNNSHLTSHDNDLTETTTFPVTTKPDITTNIKPFTTPKTLPKTTTSTSLIITTKNENDATSVTTAEEAPIDSKKTTSVPADNSENPATTDKIIADTTNIFDSKTTPFFATTLNENRIISSTSIAKTSSSAITVSSPQKATTTIPMTTTLFSSISNPTINSSLTTFATQNIITLTSSIMTPKMTSLKSSTMLSTTRKQQPSSTVKLTAATTANTNKATTIIKPKTTSKSSSSFSKTTTKISTTSNEAAPSSSTIGSTKMTMMTTLESSRSPIVSSSSANPFLNISTTTPLSTSKSPVITSTTSSSATPLSTQKSTSKTLTTSSSAAPLSTQKSTSITSTTSSSATPTKSLNQTLTTVVQTKPTSASLSSTQVNPVTSVTTTSTTTMPPTQQINTKVTTPSNSGTTSISINELEYLSKAYKLNSNQSTITIETNAQQSLITIAASLSDAEKNALGYKIGDLIQTCIINGVPCNMERDFTQIYDVDYGFCYTFNYAALYNTTQMGSNHGLKMVVLSDINEYIATSSEQGIKVVVHYQEESPFPNVGGYRSATGKNIDLRVTYGLVSRLDAPYGTCNNLDKLKELNQPFYFNGTYTVEGCYRSCFQQKVSVACNCSDPRFPLPTDLSTSFCKISDIQKYNCYEKYIEENGDYYNVEDCSCAISCDDTTFNSAVYYSNWPYGTFFYQALCTNATFTNGTDCQKYYRENGVLVQVSYARLGYETIEEVPVNTAFDLFNNLAGNTGLWIGFSAITAAEFILVFIQICLWICTPWELKEVPSCRQRNYPEPETDSENCTEETNSTAAIVGAGSAAGIGGAYSNLFNGNMNKSAHLIEPKSFPNEIRRRHHGLMVTDPSSIFESIKPVSHVDVYDSQLITPTPVQSIITEVVPEI